MLVDKLVHYGCHINSRGVQGSARWFNSEKATRRNRFWPADTGEASKTARLSRKSRPCCSHVRRLDGEDVQRQVSDVSDFGFAAIVDSASSGFDFTLHEVDREHLEDEIRHANTDDNVDGVIVYYPVFDSRRDQTLQWAVSMYKDVEGLSPQLISNMYQNIRFLDPPANSRKSILPCTPLAVIKILEYLQIYNTFLDYGKRLFGRRITVINRSEVVGRPLAALLANDGAEVYSVDVTGVQQFSRGSGLTKQRHDVREMEGWSLEQCLPISDVVISGVPGEAYKVPTSLIREGAVCINFSSEKVCNSADPLIRSRLLTHSELQSRRQREGLHLRSGDWQGDYRCLVAQLAAYRAEQATNEWRHGMICGLAPVCFRLEGDHTGSLRLH